MGDRDNQDLGLSNHSNHSSHSKKSNRKDPITLASVMATIRSYFPEHIFTPAHFHLHKPHREYDLTILQRIFVMIEEADSCILGVMISAIMAGLIVLGVILYVLANDPSFTYVAKCANLYLCPTLLMFSFATSSFPPVKTNYFM